MLRYRYHGLRVKEDRVRGLRLTKERQRIESMFGISGAGSGTMA
jgi:hypothetical protein